MLATLSHDFDIKHTYSVCSVAMIYMYMYSMLTLRVVSVNAVSIPACMYGYTKSKYRDIVDVIHYPYKSC